MPKTTTKTGFNKPYLKRLIAYLIIISVGILIYANTVHYPFVFDDKLTIVENKSIQSNEIYKDVFQSRYIGLISFALNYRINGFDTFGYHLVNISIHILNAILVFELFYLMIAVIGNEKLLNQRYRIALFIAAIFLVHPVQTQAVTYIVQRFASLSALFVLLSILLYIKFRSSKPACYFLYVLSIIAALFAFKTKENTATLPLMLGVVEWLLFRQAPDSKKKKMLYLVPYCILFIVIPLSFINIHKPLSSMPEEIIAKSHESPDIKRSDYFFTEMRVMVTYMRLLVVPVKQSIDYPFALSRSLKDLKTVLSMIFLALILGIGIWLRRWYVLVTLGILWFFIFLIVESTVIPIADLIFEHRIYLSSIGFIAAVVGLGFYLAKPSYSKIIILMLIAAVHVLAISAYKRNHVWSNDITLWENAISKYPTNQRAYVNLGSAYLDKQRYSDVIRIMEHIFTLDPNNANSFYLKGHGNLALAYARMGMYDKALREYQKVIQIDPHISAAYAFSAAIYMRQGKTEEAMKLLQKGREYNPDNPIINAVLGSVYCQQGDIDTGVFYFQRALTTAPDYVNGHLQLAYCYQQYHRTQEARIHLLKVIELQPDSVDPYFFIAATYDLEDNYLKAVEYYQLFLEHASSANPLVPTAQSRLKELKLE
jgi:protein O-mannosyl-transferase